MATRPEYLQQRKPEKLRAYHESLQQAAVLAAKLRPLLDDTRARDLQRCVGGALNDAAWALKQWESKWIEPDI